MKDDDDVKELLGRALGQEPPLGIDRDEVFRQGRKRLRRRRFFEAGSVVAAVVVAAVGAATLTDLADRDEDRMPPAASSTAYAPPGPGLPLPPSSKVPVGPPSSIETSEPGLTAQSLTTQLYASGLLPPEAIAAMPGSRLPPQFQQQGETYVWEADITPGGETGGSIQITVDRTSAPWASCDMIPHSYGRCDVRGNRDAQVALSHWLGADGDRRTFAVAVSADGIRVAAMASNITERDLRNGKQPPDTDPVLSDQELCVLVTKAGLGVG